jgi:hypothetical protein
MACVTNGASSPVVPAHSGHVAKNNWRACGDGGSGPGYCSSCFWDYLDVGAVDRSTVAIRIAGATKIGEILVMTHDPLRVIQYYAM